MQVFGGDARKQKDWDWEAEAASGIDQRQGTRVIEDSVWPKERESNCAVKGRIVRKWVQWSEIAEWEAWWEFKGVTRGSSLNENHRECYEGAYVIS